VLGVLGSVILAIPIFKYANRQQSREPTRISEQAGLGTSGAQAKSDAPGSDLDVAPPSLAPSTGAEPQRSVPLSYTSQNPFQSSPAVHRVQSATPHSEGDREHSTVSPARSESKRVKNSATPQQLWGSVQAGNSNAAVTLADMYLNGDGVPANCDQARVLLLIASEKNNQEAIRKLRDLDKTGCPTH
jgi:TPR repeat protein